MVDAGAAAWRPGPSAEVHNFLTVTAAPPSTPRPARTANGARAPPRGCGGWRMVFLGRLSRRGARTRPRSARLSQRPRTARPVD